MGETTLLKTTLHVVVELMQPSVLVMASQLQTEGIHCSEMLCRQRVLCDGQGETEGLLPQLMVLTPAAQQALLVAVWHNTMVGHAPFPCDHVQVFQDAVEHTVIEDHLVL